MSEAHFGRSRNISLFEQMPILGDPSIAVAYRQPSLRMTLVKIIHFIHLFLKEIRQQLVLAFQLQIKHFCVPLSPSPCVPDSPRLRASPFPVSPHSRVPSFPHPIIPASHHPRIPASPHPRVPASPRSCVPASLHPQGPAYFAVNNYRTISRVRVL